MAHLRRKISSSYFWLEDNLLGCLGISVRFRFFISCILGFLVFLLTSVETAQAQAVYWAKTENCETLLENPVRRIPGGFTLKEVIGEDKLAIYELPNGGHLKIRFWEVDSLPVRGKTFDEAYKDLMVKRPLQDRVSRKVANEVVLANVTMKYRLGLRFTKTDDGLLYKIKPGTFSIFQTAKVKVIDWADYHQADLVSREKWDKLTCESYHHELGHVLVAAQILAESEAAWLDLRAEDQKAMSEKTDELFEQILERVRNRQKRYHEEIELMGPEVADARPYLELSFSWLK